MIDWFKRTFHPKRLLVVATICSVISLLFAYLTPFIHPATIGFLPFFGLGYWIIIILNLLMLIIWCFVQIRWAGFILLVILLGGRLHFRMLTLGGDEECTGGTELSVMSYNVRLFDLYTASRQGDQTVKNKIFDYLKTKDPDIVCFQEFFHQDPPTLFVTKDSLLKFIDFVDYHERYYEHEIVRQYFGVALFSKYPIIEKGIVNFQNQKESPNYCIYVDIVKNKDTFRVYNVHLQSIKFQRDDYALFNIDDPDASYQSSSFLKMLGKVYRAYPIRAKQAEIVAEHVGTSPYPVILCGDFNDTPLSYCYNAINSQLTDAYRNTSTGIGSTYAGTIPAGRIDYIFHSEELGSREFSIQKEQLSDHFAIDCKVFLKKD